MRNLSIWRRKWTKKDLSIAVAVFLIVVVILVHINSWLDAYSYGNPSVGTTNAVADMVDLTLLRNAKDRGAVCLDGSSPGYYFKKGLGSGSSSWLLHIEGGGWCNSVSSCYFRSKTALGSSKFMEPQVHFSGILSNDPSQNPDFFNWNKVKIRYCDGASFAGHPESELKNGTTLFFRGQLIWEAIMEEVLSLGLSNANQAILSGCSAGGLATLIHCDDFRGILPKDSNVKCVADAGKIFLETAP